MKRMNKFTSGILAAALAFSCANAVTVFATDDYEAHMEFRYQGIDTERGVGTAPGTSNCYVTYGFLSLINNNHVDASGTASYMATPWTAETASMHNGAFSYFYYGQLKNKNYGW